jgi:hypothetical protein
MMTTERDLAQRTIDVTAEFDAIMGRLARRWGSRGAADPRVLAVIVAMEDAIERAIGEASDKLRRLDQETARPS